MQPEVLRDIAGMPGFRGLGLLARILFSMPVNTVGRRKVGAPPVAAEVAGAYSDNLSDLVLALAEWTDPAVLMLTREANERVLDIERTVEPRLAGGGAWANIVDWGSKYVGAVVRIAGLLHLAERARLGKPLTIDVVERASAIGDYFAAHALAAFDDMGADSGTRNARSLLAWIERTGVAAFTKREVFRALKCSQMPSAGDFDGPLVVLEAHGYLHVLDPPTRPRKGGRPPSPSYVVHPEVHKPVASVHQLASSRRSA